MSTLSAPIKIFCSYAHEDESHLQMLHTHLHMLKREKLISAWYDRQIVPGTDWAQTIDTHLEQATIILLLVSPDFLASDYCYEIEMKRALQRHDANQARVIPILLRACEWSRAPFARLQCLPRNGTAITSWNDQDLAWNEVTTGIREAIEDHPIPSTTTPQVALPPLWNILHSRNLFFTGRKKILTELADVLKTGRTTAISQPQAICGLGGIGKTQIAIEYANQHRQDYRAVFWTLADTRESLVSGYVAIADLLQLPEKDEQDQTITVKAVLHWLTTNTKWLLILDNADDLVMVQEFLPTAFSGHILLTTRTQVTGKLAHHFEVDIMPQDVGAHFLLRRAKLITLNASFEDADASDIATAREICDELGGLPLALDQAGAYIEATHCSLAGYLNVYRDQRSEMLKRRGHLEINYPQSVAKTWSLSFERLEQANPTAADLLRVCAFLAPDAIPEEIITQGARHLGPLLTPLTDPLVLNDAISALLSYSFVSRNATDKTLSIHRLVQAVLKDRMDDQSLHQWGERVVQAVGAVLPEVSHRGRERYERYLAHALECAQLIEQLKLASLDAARLLYQTARYLREYARYREAEPLYSQALHICEQILSPDHPNVAYPLTGLANLYYDQQNYTEAEPLFQRALRIWEQGPDSENPNVAYPLNGLANLYTHQGKYKEAEPLYQRALRIWEQIPDSENLNVAYPLNGLANLYTHQGKYKKAEEFYQRTLSLYEQVLSPGHPHMAYPLTNLANLYREQGKREQADRIYQFALSIYRQVLGKRIQGSSSSGTLDASQRLHWRKANGEPEWPLREPGGEKAKNRINNSKFSIKKANDAQKWSFRELDQDTRAEQEYSHIKRWWHSIAQSFSAFFPRSSPASLVSPKKAKTMKKLVNNPKDIVKEALAGMLDAHDDLISVDIEKQVIIRKDAPVEGKVAIISSGGSGHEPLHSGFVGRGMLHATCIGPIFTSPTRDQILAATRLVNAGAGILYILKNHHGDKSNFWSAAVELAADDINIAVVFINDDVGVPDQIPSNRRGTGLAVLLEKIVGSCAEAGASLDEVAALAEKVNKNGRSMGMALTPCILPTTGRSLFELRDDEMMMGTGIHGERGHSIMKLETADKITGRLVLPIINDLGLKDGEKVLAMVNGMGGTPRMELYVIFRALKRILKARNITIAHKLVGNYVTSLEMAGCSITLVRLDEELTRYWEAPVCTPDLRWGC